MRDARPFAGVPSQSVAIGRLEARITHIAQLALVAHRGGHRLNSYLAVAIVEILVVALGVLALLRRPGGIHCLLQSVLG